MRAGCRHRGFVLLLSLMLILLVGVALAGLARRSVVTAVETRNAVESLQQRWAAKSCRATLLHRVGDVLDAAERNANRREPAARLCVCLVLAGRDYELVFTDEQAKCNVNTLLEDAGRAEVQSIIKDLIRRGSRVPEADDVRLRAVAFGRDRPLAQSLPPVGAYGQIFDNAGPELLLGAGAGPADVVTCWGDGRVNVHRAPPAVVERRCAGKLDRSRIAAILAERQRDRSRSLEQILAALDEFDAEDKATARQCLADRSSCYGLWIVTHDADRSQYRFIVAQMSDGSASESGGRTVSRWYEFAW